MVWLESIDPVNAYIRHSTGTVQCRCTSIQYSEVLQVYLSTVQCSVPGVPQYSTVQYCRCTSNISSLRGDDGGAGEKRPCNEQVVHYFLITSNVERRYKMESNLPVEGISYWREKWGPLVDGLVMWSPGDMCNSISSRSIT
jgi:hypothetical protein